MVGTYGISCFKVLEEVRLLRLYFVSFMNICVESIQPAVY